jgi:outer membrane protein OmpA-like peptidoglycan-associated protein
MLLAEGTCTITASQAGDATYAAAADVVRSFQVTALAPTGQTITFPQPADVRLDAGPVSLSATASSGLAVVYASATAAVCTVSGSSVTLVAVGTCTITASQAGDSSHDAAADVSRSFTVSLVTPVIPTPAPTPAPAPAPAPAPRRAPQTIAFAPLAEPPVVTATASSGLPVTYGDETPSVCTRAGEGTVLVVATGTCTIVARQAGNGAWLPAPDARLSFPVTLPPLEPPANTPVTTTAGRTTQGILTGVPAGSSLALTPAKVPGVAAARIESNHVIVTPKSTFSGIVRIPVVMTVGERTVETTVAVVVRPKPPVAIAITPESKQRTHIAWKASASAVGYEVRIGARLVCRTTSTGCDVAALVVPNANVVVTSLGRAGTRSDDVAGAYRATKPVLLAVVHFASDSSSLAPTERHILDATEARILRAGFTHATLMCHTDSVGSLAYNMALSAARCAAVAGYVKRRLGIAHVTYRQSAFGFLRPTASNASPWGMAQNRRVELYVR